MNFHAPGDHRAPPDLVPLAPGVLLDTARYQVYRAGQAPVVLTVLEWRVLTMLRAHAGHVVPARQLAEAAWPHKDRSLAELYDVIYRLRHLVEGDSHHPQILVTRRGFGDVWQAPP